MMVTLRQAHTKATMMPTSRLTLSSNSANVEQCDGDQISVLWPLDQKYYPGTVHSAEDDGRVNLHYDDGDTECLDMKKEVWKLTNTLASSSSQSSSVLQVTSTEESVLTSMLDHFGNKPFMRHQAQMKSLTLSLSIRYTDLDVSSPNKHSTQLRSLYLPQLIALLAGLGPLSRLFALFTPVTCSKSHQT